MSAELLKQVIGNLRQATFAKDYSNPESFINLPQDENILKSITAIKEKKNKPNLKYIFVAGIGGANLGAKAVYDALFGYFDNFYPQRLPKMIFLDTINPKVSASMSGFIEQNISSADEILVCIVSKSGETIETIANLQEVSQILEKKFGDIKERVIVVTKEGTRLWQISKEKGIDTLTLPETVVDRYSVFSAVGLTPLSFLPFDTGQFLDGAKGVVDSCLSDNPEQNPAMLSAIIISEHYKTGKSINDNFFFHPELESLGKWYRQLMAESLGEEKRIEGRLEKVGITPTVSIGSMDLHSMAQLYLAGPQNQITTFVYAKDTGVSPQISNSALFANLSPDVSGETPEHIVSAMYRSIKTSYIERGIPFMEVVLPDLSAHSLGSFMQFKMIEMIYLGALIGVYVFDQPNVEEYKQKAKEMLAKK